MSIDDREPEPPESEPLTLELIGAAHRAYLTGSTPAEREQALTLLLDEALPQLLAEVAWWRGLHTEREYALTQPGAETPGSDAHLIKPDSLTVAQWIAAHQDAQAWTREVRYGPWQQLSTEPPF